MAIGRTFWPIGLAAWAAGEITFAVDMEEQVIAWGPLIGVGVSLFVTGLILNGVGKGRLNSLVYEYNSGRTRTLSMSVQPSLMYTYDKSYAPGVGIALRF